MTEKLVALQIWIGRRAEARGDQGQGALEYVGAIVIAAAVVVAVAGAFNSTDIGQKVADAVTGVLDLNP